MSNKAERLYFLDNMRSLVAIWVVVLHGAISYMEYGPPYYAVIDSQRSVVFSLMVMLVEPTLMTAMFFIAAYFALPSLAARGAGEFLKSKFLRIGGPWVLGVLLVNPSADYLIYLARKNPIGWFEFCTGEFWRLHYHQGPYWFLGVLMVFFVLFTLACKVMPGLMRRPDRVWIPSWWMLVVFWAVMTLGMFAVQAVWDTHGRFHIFGHIVAVMPHRIHIYSSFFILGLVAWRNRWFTSEGYNPRPAPWLVLLGVSMALYAAILGLGTDERSLETLARVLHLDSESSTLHAASQMKPVLKLLTAAVFNALSLSGLLGVGALFKRCFNSPGPVQRSLAANSLGIYFIHPVVLYPIAYLFLDITTLPLAVKFSVVVSLGFFLSWAASALILRKAPLLRQLF
ncbi:acyltransferase family protein [Prosthecobacter sp.]|uniref:acyltransferase family protein n=1 Tax=Prosthecobacter sp. TaxID=1965333 RepID=UPI002AB9D280|nr:acyltransferase family protein [Prosthecobacter sp.]MDZ4404750.1 acyltransferase family protein [Prosthecobacter sp.]